MIADLNAGHCTDAKCSGIVRAAAAASTDSHPLASLSLSLYPVHRPFFAPESLVILFPRRFSPRSSPPLLPASSDSYRKFVPYDSPFPPSPSLRNRALRHPIVPFPFPPSLSPSRNRSGQRALPFSRGSGYGNGRRRRSLRVSGSFCFCSAFHAGIGNAYFITARCLAGIWQFTLRARREDRFLAIARESRVRDFRMPRMLN